MTALTRLSAHLCNGAPPRPAYTPPTPKSARHRWRKRRSAR